MSEWHKASYSGASNDCVEVREHANAADVRDTRNREHGHLTFAGSEWAAFLEDVKSGAL